MTRFRATTFRWSTRAGRLLGRALLATAIVGAGAADGVLAQTFRVSVPAGEAPPDPTKMRVLELTVPLPAPSARALQHSLRYDTIDMRSDSAAMYYMRASELVRAVSLDDVNAVADMMVLPLDSLDEVRAARILSGLYADVHDLLRIAATCSVCDWQLPVQEIGPGVQFPELGTLRKLARFLALKARVEMKAGKLDEALSTIRIIVAMARHATEAPTLIHSLVGCAIMAVAVQQIELFVTLPGSPSMYWPLTELGTPVLTLEEAYRHEKHWVDSAFKELRDIDSGKLSPEASVKAWRDAISKLESVNGSSHGSGSWGEFRDKLGSLSAAVEGYPDAKAALLARGYTEQQVDAMPVSYVSLRHALSTFLLRQDDIFKWTTLPYWQSMPGLLATVQSYENNAALARCKPLEMFSPGIHYSVRSWVTNERHWAAMRCVEAVRLYAAAHGGKLPASLNDVQEVPLPIDPVTGRWFDYRLDGETAVITGETALNLRSSMGYEYRVRVAK